MPILQLGKRTIAFPDGYTERQMQAVVDQKMGAANRKLEEWYERRQNDPTFRHMTGPKVDRSGAAKPLIEWTSEDFTGVGKDPAAWDSMAIATAAAPFPVGEIFGWGALAAHESAGDDVAWWEYALEAAPFISMAAVGAVGAGAAAQRGLIGPGQSGPKYAIDQTGAITVYHGSPHDFDKFEWHEGTRGTGEGAQAFGDGLYFADSEDLAIRYRDALKRLDRSDLPVPQQQAVSVIEDVGGDLDAAIKSGSDELLGAKGKVYEGALRDRQAALEGFKVSGVPDFSYDGHLYTADLDVEPEDLLDWDLPLSEQSASVKEKLRPITDYMLSKPLADHAKTAIQDGSMTGEGLRHALSGEMMFEHGLDARQAGAKASEAFLAEGIPGLRFLDGNSRSAGEGTRNYVMFGDELVDIVEKDGVPVPRAKQMYHGTGEDFTEFDRPTFLTDIPEQAQKYAERKPGGRVLGVNTKASKTFDPRVPEHRQIFEQEYYRKFGSGAPLSDEGLPDWTDADDLREFLQDRGYDFDSVAVSEPPALSPTGSYEPVESLYVFDPALLEIAR